MAPRPRRPQVTEPSADPLEVSISRLVAEQVGARGDGDGLSGEQNASSAP